MYIVHNKILIKLTYFNIFELVAGPGHGYAL